MKESSNLPPTQKPYYAIANSSNIRNNEEPPNDMDQAAITKQQQQQQHQVEKDRRWAMTLFAFTSVLLFADQNLMAPNLTAIAEEFGMDDDERDWKLGGHIALAFWLLGAPAAIVVGILADKYNRSRLFAWVVGLGEGACFLTYWSKTYGQLYACRAITGFSIGGALPLIYSILGDLFPADQRHQVNALVGIGTGMGISVGQGVAGFLGPTFGWRLPFLVVSVPAITCAVLVAWTVQDPERGGMEQVVLEQQKQSSTMDHNDNNNLHHFSTDSDGKESLLANQEVEMQPMNSNIEATINDASDTSTRSAIGARRRSPSRSMEWSKQGSVDQQFENIDDDDDDNEKYALPPTNSARDRWKQFYRQHVDGTVKAQQVLLKTPTVVLALLQGSPGCLPWGVVNTYLNDFLAEDRGMSVEFATFTVLWFGVGNFFGLVAGGAGGQYLYQVDKRYPALFAGTMAIFGCVPFWVLLNGVNNHTSGFFTAAIALVAGASAGVTGPIIKATLQNVTLPQMRGQAFALFNTFDDFGKGLGPVFVAYLITSAGGRTPAFNLATSGWAICGFFNLLVFFTAETDERRCQAALSATLSQRQHSEVFC